MRLTKRFQDSANRGFTLIEILVVFVLMSMMLGISVFYFANSVPKAKHKATAREIITIIKYAKNLAAAKNERQILNFDLDAGRYGIEGRGAKKIPEGITLVIYESAFTANPVKKGQYHIAYDSTGTNHWDKIIVARGERVIQINADPILTAVLADGKKDGRDE